MTTSIELSNCSIWQQVSLHLIEHRLCPLPIRIMHARNSEFTTGLLQERHDGMKVLLAQKARLYLQEREAGAVDRCAAIEHGQRSRDGRGYRGWPPA